MTKKKELCRVKFMKTFEDYYNFEQKNIILNSIRVAVLYDDKHFKNIPFDIQVAGENGFRVKPYFSKGKLNMSNKTLELLYAPENGKVINYNVYGNKIFFHVEGGDNAGLYRMNVDGTQLEYVAVGEISGIHCTSKYTFFSYYEDQSTLYRIPTTAPITTIEEISIN